MPFKSLEIAPSAEGGGVRTSAWILLPLATLSHLACEDARLDPLPGGIWAEPASLDFGPVYLGHPAERQVALAVGARPVRLIAVSAADPAFRAVEPPEALAGGAQVNLRIEFAPTVVGVRSSTLSVLSDVPGAEPLRIALRGEGRSVPDCDDGNDCTEDRFDFGAGACVRAPRVGACDDHSACTTDDRCESGRCVGAAIRCNDGVECTSDYCDPTLGCTARPNDGVCADQDPCTVDQCTSSGCQNPVAPNGTACGPAVSCQTAQICLFHQCVEVDLPDGVPCDDGDPCTIEDHCASRACVGRPEPTPPVVRSESFRYADARSAGFIGEQLYLSPTPPLLGHYRQRSYAVAELGGSYGLSASPLTGAAGLIAIGAGRYARISNAATGTTSEVAVEVLEAADPLRPLVVAARRSPGLLYRGTFSYHDRALFFCKQDALGYVDLQDPLNPGPFVELPSPELGPCAPLSHIHPDLLAAEGGVWTSAFGERGSFGPAARVYRVSRAGAELILSNFWNPSGAHQYGSVRQLAVSASHAVYNLDNPRRLFWSTWAPGAGPAEWHGLEHGLTEQSDLLGLDGAIAWFFDTDHLEAIDLSDPAAPHLSQRIAVGAWRRPVRLLAKSPGRFVLAEASDQVHVVDRASLGVEALRGLGGIDELRPISGGYGAFSRYGGTAVYGRAALTSTGAPDFSPSGEALPMILDQGRSGLRIAAQGELDLYNAGCQRPLECQVQVPYAFGPIMSLSAELHAGPVQTPSALSGLTTLRALTSRGCRTLALGGPGLTVVELELCGASLRMSAHPEYGTLAMDERYLRGIDHGPAVTFLSDRGARLVTKSASVTPSRLRDLSGPVYSAGYDVASTRWVLSAGTGPLGSAELWVHELGQQDRHFRAPELDGGGGAILAVTGRAALVSGDREGEELLVYDLDRETLLHRIRLSLPAISATIEPTQVVVGRADGVTVLGPICLPRED